MQIEIAIEWLIAQLDEIDGDKDLEPSLTGYSSGMDNREGDPADAPEEDPVESGIADIDGVMEQFPQVFQHSHQRVEA